MEKLYNFKIDPSLKEVQRKDTQKSFIEPSPEDGSVVNYAGTSLAMNFSKNNYNSSNEKYLEKQQILNYRECSNAIDVENAIDEIVNEAIPTENNSIEVKIILDKLNELDFLKNNKKLSNHLKNEIYYSHTKILNLLEFHSTGDSLFRDWYIDGRLYVQKIYDEKNPSKGLTGLKKIDSLHIYKIFNIIKDNNKNRDGEEVVVGTEEYFIYDKKIATSIKDFSSQAIKIPKELITYVTSGKIDPTRTFVYSYLEKALKPLRNIQLLEDSQIVYRIARAPERKAFYVDVGNKRGPEAERFLKSIADAYREKLHYDTKTGSIRDEKRFKSVLDDYWFATSNGSASMKVDTIGGEKGALSDISDLVLFKKNLFRALNVPTSRLDNDSPFSFGKGMQLTLEEVKFKKFIDKIRRQFSILFLELLRDDLALRNIITLTDWNELKKVIRYTFSDNNSFEEAKELEVISERAKLALDLDMLVGRYISQEYVLKNVFRFSDDDIAKEREKIEQERNLPDYLRPPHEVEQEKLEKEISQNKEASFKNDEEE